MMINRETASSLLFDLSSRGLLDEGLCDSLQEIANCIDAERKGFHIWGANDDHSKLFTAYREDLLTDELKEELEGIYKKYTFEPSPFEREE